MNRVYDINSRKPHEVFEAVCLKCQYRYISVKLAETLLKELECPNCGKVGYIIKTGESNGFE